MCESEFDSGRRFSRPRTPCFSMGLDFFFVDVFENSLGPLYGEFLYSLMDGTQFFILYPIAFVLLWMVFVLRCNSPSDEANLLSSFIVVFGLFALLSSLYLSFMMVNHLR